MDEASWVIATANLVCFWAGALGGAALHAWLLREEAAWR